MSKNKEVVKDELPLKAIIYTDGGCKPSRGIGGWGIHGYIFKDTPAKQGTGGCKSLPGLEGYISNTSGIPNITVINYIDGFGSLIPESTNNRAEITAVIKALEFVLSNSIKDVKIILDSQYTLQGMTEWLPNWVANNFIKSDSTEVLNSDLWKELDKLLNQFKEQQITLSFKKIKGHSGDLGNDLADLNATRGVVAGNNNLSIESLVTKDSKGYWKGSIEKNRLFSLNSWYFGTQGDIDNKTEDGRYVYYTGDLREDDDFLGKKISKAIFSILYLKYPEPVLDILRKAVSRMGMDQYQGLSIGYLDQIFKPDIYKEILDTGEALLIKDYARQRISTSSSTLLSKEIRPARRAYHAVDTLMTLEDILKSFINTSSISRIRKTEITSELYVLDQKDKKGNLKLSESITSEVKHLDVDVGYVIGEKDKSTKIRLSIGLDIPDRNTLVALAGKETKIYVVTWPESARAFRFATIIEKEEDIGIWAGIYSNLHLLPTS